MYPYRPIEGRFKDRVVLITGAGNGIGRSISLRFAEEGAKCVICDIDEQGLAETAQMIKGISGISDCSVLDVEKKDKVENAVKEIVEKYGQIHVLINCAGVVQERNCTDISEDEWKKTMGVNLDGVFYVTQPVLKNMIKFNYGKIVNISSQSGIFGRKNRSAYSASKAGLNGFTRSLALEVAQYGINVNAVCPSRIVSSMTKKIMKDRANFRGIPYEEIRDAYTKSVPIGRLGLPEDVASITGYLASDEASYITGQLISTSGGR